MTTTASTALAQNNSSPNIIIILADDLGFGDIQGFGGSVKTPNLHRLRMEGMRFNNFYAQPQCSPSRAALVTGCYPQRVGFSHVVGPLGPEWTKDLYNVGLNPDEETLPELLKKKNYATATFGKWHLGHCRENLPGNHGFDEYWGLPYSNDMWPANSSEWPDLPLVKDYGTVQLNPDQRTLTKRYTELSIDFIMRNKSKPFFLYVAHSMPHVPLYTAPEFESKSVGERYADVVRELDWSVGRIMKTLSDESLEENTIVVFTSDNGPWLRYGNHAGSAGGLREGKATTFEGGVRVPMIVKWKGKIKPNSETSHLAGLIDIFPTIAELVGVKPEGKGIDGRSMAPLLLGNYNYQVRDVHYYFHLDELQAVRKGKWKLHLPHLYEHVTKAGSDGSKGTIEMREILLSLFDLEADPAEETNVAKVNQSVVDELTSLAQQFSSHLQNSKRSPWMAVDCN